MLLLCSCIRYTHSQGKHIQLVNSQSGPLKCGHPHNKAILKVLHSTKLQATPAIRTVLIGPFGGGGGGGGGGGRKGRESITYHCHAVFPSSYFFPTAETMSVNGSSAAGNCSSDTVGFLSRCDAPTSSVLFYGNIPALTGLDDDMWASQLLTLQTTGKSIKKRDDFRLLRHTWLCWNGGN